MALYFRVRDHREVSASEALDARGVLKHGYGQRVPAHMRDGAPRFSDGVRAFWDANRDRLLVVDARRIGGVEGNKPGFRIFDNDLGRQAKLDAYQQYEAELTSAYRTGLGDAAPPRNPKEDEDDDDMALGELEQMTTATSDRSIDQIAHEHRVAMEKFYDSYSATISTAWKGSNK
jgi:hypothetical protein